MKKMKKVIPTLFVFVLFLAALSNCSGEIETKTDTKTNVEIKVVTDNMQNIRFLNITGDTTSLADFEGKVVLLVNVASKCGYTQQYTGLEELYQKYKDSGLVIVGFPANNFGGQEPGTNEEILNFCSSKFDVTFPMMAKVSVVGDDKHPLFVALTEQSDITGEIKWNFSKFLLDKNGKLIARYGSSVEPMSDEITGKIKELL